MIMASTDFGGCCDCSGGGGSGVVMVGGGRVDRCGGGAVRC